MSDAAGLRPISVSERIQVIDVLRGMALFGIIAANMRGFNSPARVYFDVEKMWPGTADRIVQGFIDLFISGKFITLFSFLFGLGFAVQMTRAEARGGNFASFYVRRLLALLLIGAVHVTLVWWGDILVPYALVGFSLLLFRKRAQKTVFTWAMIGLWFPTLLGLTFLVLGQFGIHPSPPGADAPVEEAIRQGVQAYGHGSWAEIERQRLREATFGYIGAPFYFPTIFGLFLLGLYVWRRGIFQDVPAHVPLLRRALRWGLALGLAGNVGGLLITILLKPHPMKPSLWGLARGVCGTIGVPALSCFYASALLLLFQSPVWRARLLPFGVIGRTALSNYLVQSVVCTMLYYNYGFGLFGRVGPAVGLVLTVVIYAAQIPLSQWWLRHYQFGPMEWAWRSMSYGRFQSMRIQQTTLAAEA